MKKTFKELIIENNIYPEGIIQVGSNVFQEKEMFIDAGFNRFVLIEPDENSYLQIKEKTKGMDCIVYNVAISDYTATSQFFCANNQSLSSSLLEPKDHLIKYPEVKFEKRSLVKVQKLSDVHFNRKKYNVLYIDVQGGELEVLKSAEPLFFNHIDAIFTEINFIHMYKDCALIEEIDKFLKIYDFERVFTDYSNFEKGWGDAFYIKNS